MSELAGLADPQYVSEQYRTANNINSRIGLHERFSTNPYGWHRWVYDRLHLPGGGSILELGCGAGTLWKTNLDRLPGLATICLSDLSEGMLAQAQENLGGAAGKFEFRQVDAGEIPFPNGSFDVVIANHMLYHVPDQMKALTEIRRVLTKDGCLYASTVGTRHLLELRQMLARFSPILAEWGVIPGHSFTLENGAGKLARFFPHVRLDCYPDALRVTETEALIGYVCSGRIRFTSEEKARFIEFIRQELAKRGGEINISKDSGLFSAQLVNGIDQHAH